MDTQIVFRAYNTKRQMPVKLSPLEDKSGKLYTGQGEHGYFNLLSDEEKKKLPVIIDHSTVVMITDGKVLDLRDPIDAANWKWIQKHPYVALDKAEGLKSRDAVYYVDNPKKEAESRVTRDKRITMAKAKVYAASNARKTALAKALGNPGADSLGVELVEDWLSRFAEKNPDTITTLLDSKNQAEVNARILFQELRQYNLVTIHAGTWRFGGKDGVPLGHSESLVIEYLLDKKNEEQVFIMSKQLDEKKTK